MTELTEPLTAGLAAGTNGDMPAGTVQSHALSFSELVYTHYAWWREQRHDRIQTAAKTAYDAAVADFERRHGEIASAYWCSHVESGAALTHKKRPFPFVTRPAPSTGRRLGDGELARHHV